MNKYVEIETDQIVLIILLGTMIFLIVFAPMFLGKLHEKETEFCKAKWGEEYISKSLKSGTVCVNKKTNEIKFKNLTE